MTHPKESTVSVNGQELFVKEWSDHGPLLLLLHHMTGSNHTWNNMAPEMAGDYRVIAPDFRGHGLSSRPSTGYSWAGNLADDMVGLITHYTDESAIAIGRSMGAMVSIPVAVKCPSIVSDIILIDPPAYRHASYYDYFQSRVDFLLLPFDDKVERLKEKGRSPEDAIATARWSERTHPGILQDYVAGHGAFEVADWLPQVTCRTHLLYANTEMGGVLRMDEVAALSELYPFSHVSYWPDSGHGLGEEEPDRLVGELRSMLEA